MNKGELFFRSLIKSLEGEKIKSTLDNNKRDIKIPVEFNSKGEIVVANIVFKVEASMDNLSQVVSECVEVYPNKFRKEDEKNTIEMDSFLYRMRLTDDQADEFEQVRAELRKKIMFGKRELNHLKKASSITIE
jgi:hypothetical protein